MIKDENAFAHALLNVNEWWVTGKSRKAGRYPKKRAIFPKLKQELGSKRIVILSGPRRVGKSVLLHQLVQELIDSGVAKESILHYQLDDPTIHSYSDEPLKDMIDYALSRAKGKAYIFFDEIQAYKGWHEWVKTYYDRDLDIKFILSGSSSLKIQTDANRYLRGRTVEMELFPLDFREFLSFDGTQIPEIDKNNALGMRAAQNRLAKAIGDYLLVGGFPEWFEIKNEEAARERWLTHLLADVPKKAIYEDIAVYFNIRNPKVIDLLFSILAINQSKPLSYEKMNEVANLDRATLLNYVEFLKSSYLILDVPVYGSPRKQIKAMKKFLIIDQGLRNAMMKEYVLKEDNQGFIIENLVGTALALNYKNVTYWKEQNYEVDFVVNDIPVEVKYQNVIVEKDYRGLLRFLERYNGGHGVMITKDTCGEKMIDGKRIVFVPFWVFLLEPEV
ncbi:ATP-binding protein [Candidatus Micrarchaeota archaeon]|nr:ATP-binding protein [Candidatus Micrarchaeota archaeon]